MPRLNLLLVQTEVDVERQREDDVYEAHNGDAWHFLRGTWSVHGLDGLGHDNFFCDMILRLNGDFTDRSQRAATLEWLEQRLNGTLKVSGPLPDWAKGRWTVSTTEKTVFHSNPVRDLGLRVSGDFGSSRQRSRALEGIARLLNGEPLPMRRSAG